MNDQKQCSLFRLPAEIRAAIYLYSLISLNDPIMDPTIGKSAVRSKHKSIPPFGTNLLSTCRKLYDEVDIRPLYTSNEFIFTSAWICSDFLTLLSEKHKCYLTQVTFDFRSISSSNSHHQPGRINTESLHDWSHYLKCAPAEPGHRSASHPGYCRKQTNRPHLLQPHIPPLRTIVLDLCELQRLLAVPPAMMMDVAIPVKKNSRKRKALWGCWWDYCWSGSMAIGRRGSELRLRRLDEKGLVREVSVPVGMWSDDEERERERRRVLEEWCALEFGWQEGSGWGQVE